MVEVSRAAVEIQQGELTVYLTYVTPAELVIPDFYTVEKLDPQSDAGFHRLLQMPGQALGPASEGGGGSRHQIADPASQPCKNPV